MTRPVSQRTLAANRQNAKNSTGPKTPKGKARSAKNALRHGLLSAADVVVTTGDGAERPEEFRALLDRLIMQFDPRDVIEQSLVERVAACFWRLRRALRFEAGALRQSLDDCERDPDHDQLTELQEELHRANDSRDQHAEYLHFLQGFDPNDPEAVNNARPILDKIRLRFSGDVWDSPLPQMCQVLLRKLPQYLHAIESDRIPALNRWIGNAHPILSQWNRVSRIEF